MNHLPKGVAHFGKRLLSYADNTPHGPITLYFADKSSAICDVLIGCDGVKSMIRKQMFETMTDKGHPELLRYVDPVWSGTIAYRCLIPYDEVPKAKGGGPHRSIKTPMMVCAGSSIKLMLILSL